MAFSLRLPLRRRRRRVQLAHEKRPVSLRTRILVRTLLATLVLATIVFAFPLTVTTTPPTYLEGTVAPEEILAPFTFEVPKSPDEVERERARAAEAVLPVFTHETETSSVGGVLVRVGQLRRHRARLNRYLDSLGVTLSPATLRMLAAPDSGAILVREASRILSDARRRGMVGAEDAGLLDGYNRVRLSTDHGEEVVSTAGLLDPRRLASTASERGTGALGAAGGTALAEIVQAFARPNLSYDPAATDADRVVARASVSPIRTTIQKGERIVDAHERITHDTVQVLEALRQAAVERGAGGGLASWLLPLLGRMLLLAVVLTLFVMFLRTARREVWDDLGLLTVITIVSLVTLGLGGVVARAQGIHPFMVPIPMAAVLVTLLIGEIVGLATVAALSVVIGAVTGWGLPVTLVGAVGGVIAVYAVRNVFQRMEFLSSIIPIGVGMAATLTGITLVGSGVPGSNLLIEMAWTGANAAFSIAVAMFLLPLFERIFHLASGITLLELSDLNRPIFKRMMIEANGTYHHSMVVGSLAEAAAEAVGANPLLARVGGYYHDIGKIAKSGYFGENMHRGMRNPHEKLTPTMSSLILESHVREGLEVAREVGLPNRVAAFIPEHQGTTLMQYFYNKALELDPEVDERDYRYPGPKPQSKETAIVMLADAAEATVRSLDEHTPNRIRAVLARLFEARIADGQLDECGLTMADLAKIRDAFTHVLTGVYHGRVKYQWQMAGGEAALEGGEERVFHPELETGIGMREEAHGFARPSEAAGRTGRG
jgi:putative nucleotidyltransferase with HDIG domain